MSKIGVGVITAGRRTLHPYLLPEGAVFHVEQDLALRGIAPTRNACLAALYDAGCDHFFLFDDDCWPVMPGWAAYFLEQHRRTGLDFFGLPEVFKGVPIDLEGEVLRWTNIVGCFSSQTRALVDTVGGWNTGYERYGFEDDARNQRVRRSGLAGGEGYPSLLRASAYIHSADVFLENPVANLSEEVKQALIEVNRPAWVQEIESPQQFYPFQVCCDSQPPEE